MKGEKMRIPDSSFTPALACGASVLSPLSLGFNDVS
jgi:hypothetical protein